MVEWYDFLFRSSRPDVLSEKGVPKNFVKFTGKHLCQRPETLFKKGLWHGVFLWICKISKPFFLQNTSGGCFCLAAPCETFCFYVSFLKYFSLTELYPVSSCQKDFIEYNLWWKRSLENSSHGFIVVFVYDWGTFVLLWKILRTESGAHRISNLANFERFFRVTS